jgi:uncharacterized protein YjbI with pentapeptide repeats
MTPDETIALWEECEMVRSKAISQGKNYEEARIDTRNCWNDWAVPLLEQRATLIANNLLSFASEQYHEFIAPRKGPLNGETEAFQKKAFVDFSGFNFKEVADFTGFVFPSDVRFDANLRDPKSSPAVFEKFVRFHDCTFHGDFIFRRTECHANAGFSGVTFLGDANFAEAVFNKSVWFREAEFYGDVWFGQTIFGGYCDFISAKFHGEAAFRGILASGIFDIYKSVFEKIPDFSQANFKEAPTLDSIIYPEHRFWMRGDAKNIIKYRALRRLAIQGHDFENEAKAFKGELRSKRFVVDRWHNPNVWLGILYDGVASCGRSIWRPFSVWLLLSIAFAYYYLTQAISKGDAWRLCIGRGGDPLVQALYVSFKNALVVFAGGRDPRLLQAYQCLYGEDENIPVVPASVSFVEVLVQTPLSATLLFLFLLAVRNQFKIK